MPKQIRLPIISEYQKELSSLFSQYSVNTNISEYSKRNQSDIQKVRLDIYNGKVAEFMVFNHFRLMGYNPTPPDIMIYPPHDKSFDADIKCGKLSIHIKSCLNDSQFPNSWMFQPKDTLVSNPKDIDTLALCVLSDEPYMYLIKANKIKGIYKKPIKASLLKKTLYEQDIRLIK